MVVQEIRQEVISNNLANVATGGYKSQAATLRSFPEVLLYSLQKERVTPIGYYSHGVMVDRIYSNWAPGTLEETGRTTDMALVQPRGDTLPAFFAVQVGTGEAYTRNGEFRVDANGFLVTPEGYPLQGLYDAIYTDTADFKVDSSGQVIVEGQVIDRLRVVTFDNPVLLQRQGDNLFVAPRGVQPLMAVDYQVKQGWLEKANVDVTRELVDVLAVLRAYEANQKVIQAIDQALGKSVNELGSIR